ncbi:hypothetical protein B0H14DRAFT_2682241 [Mycena olivaceomarginata]|nr:hypothetical protein B0H14DRAFT_2682241 [Mycena olivaceomarginata]
MRRKLPCVVPKYRSALGLETLTICAIFISLAKTPQGQYDHRLVTDIEDFHFCVVGIDILEPVPLRFVDLKHQLANMWIMDVVSHKESAGVGDVIHRASEGRKLRPVVQPSTGDRDTARRRDNASASRRRREIQPAV